MMNLPGMMPGFPPVNSQQCPPPAPANSMQMFGPPPQSNMPLPNNMGMPMFPQPGAAMPMQQPYFGKGQAARLHVMA